MAVDAGFASFYASHHAAIWAYLLRLGATPATASDLAQDTFVRWLEHDVAKVREHPRAYLYRIALHLFIDHGRRNKREVAWDAVTEVAAPEVETAGVIPQRIWSQLTLRPRKRRKPPATWAAATARQTRTTVRTPPTRSRLQTRSGWKR